ncbi:protein kinase [Frankia sp. EI5c]|uniref:protein kinase n=1 Tax=Frankia sp. EI5c TaxID=683316 RepID=UPI001F5B43F6|nr:protein kinase [Frankia sp. EI5c]
MTFTDDSDPRPGRHGGEPVVPGITLRHRRYDAGAGEVWAGRVERLGVDVTVRHVRLPADPLLRAEAAEEILRLIEVRHPHLVAVTDVVRTPDGLAVVAEPVDGAVSLSRLLAARGRLDPGEVVTIGLPVAQALAAAHAAGLVHGELTALDILLEPNGRPMLTGTALAALTDPAASAADDVRDLADLLLGAMRQATGPDAAAVAVAVAMALIDEPLRRPSAAELAAGLARSATPLPVRLADVSPGGGEAEARPELPGGAPEPAPAAAGDLDDELDPWATGPHWHGGGSDADHEGENDADYLGDEPYADYVGEPGERGHPRGAGAEGAVVDAPPWPAGGADAAWDEPAGYAHRAGQPEPAEAGGGPAAEPVGGLAPPPADGRTAPADPSELVGSLRPTGRERRPRTSRRGGRPPAVARRSGRSPGAGRGGARGRSARRARLRHRLLLPGIGCVGLAAVIVAAVLMSGASEPETRSAAAVAGGAQREPSAAPVSGRTPEQAWRAVLDELNAARSAAFERADEAALEAADAPGSPALDTDRNIISRLRERGAHSTPVRVEIIDLVIREEGADRAVLRVTESVAAYDFVDAAGAVVASEPSSPPGTKDLTLWRAAGGWRLAVSEEVAPG